MYFANLIKSLTVEGQDTILGSDNILYWSDYNRVMYDSRSYQSLGRFEKCESFQSGESLFNRDMVDSEFRIFAEDCDLLQGVQFLTSLSSAWSGFAASYIQSIRDEYPKLQIWTWDCPNATTPSKQGNRQELQNRAMGFANIHDYTSMIATMRHDCIHNVDANNDAKSPWEKSAVQCFDLDTLTLFPKSGKGPQMSDFSMMIFETDHLKISTIQDLSFDPLSRMVKIRRGVTNASTAPTLKGHVLEYTHPAAFPDQSSFPDVLNGIDASSLAYSPQNAKNEIRTCIQFAPKDVKAELEDILGHYEEDDDIE